ncbi:PilN domain-containing protein [Lacisediminimonas sp.]|uniref:PilN domain-containing protein n=1 Tax=Lacisediminimonas sp. TaxID=3060582 RepID=UPI00271FF9E8|nr:PilN domain-containing protein [Lacisediminimonas sp.]MDO8299888.1 PilN domain-containing protein [Lacisediminimonas sp.]
MIRINLLPHREARRRERKKNFQILLVASAFFGALVVLGVGSYFGTQISNQESRNAYIKAENARLDLQIKEIAALKQEIDALKARQQAVEDLQSDRNQPVYLLVELVKQVPEGIYLRTLKQTGQRVVLNGTAHSNERVSELLRNIGNSSSWLERPELVEIRATSVGSKDARKAFEFTINVGIRRARDKEAAPPSPVPVAINVVAPGAPTSGTPQPAAKPAAPKS